MNHFFYFLCLALFIGCRSTATEIDVYHSDTLKIERVGENIFKHISFLETGDYGKVSCNGMLFFNGDEAIVFDTPTNDIASSELIGWIYKTQNKKIKAVVVTHFHVDCLGGLSEFHKNNIASYASNRTIELVKLNDQAVPKNGFEQKIEFTVGNELVLGEYLGQGHTSDNIVGYIPAEMTLFGGCLIKAMRAGKGNLSDANTAEWATTVTKIKSRFPNVRHVVPGHGEHGGAALLDYTIGLFDNN